MTIVTNGSSAILRERFLRINVFRPIEATSDNTMGWVEQVRRQQYSVEREGSWVS